MNNLLYALRPLASDFLPTIAFAVVVALHVSVPVATAAALGVAVLQIVAQLALKRPIPLLQWASIGLVVVFGSVSLVTNDARFLMIKPGGNDGSVAAPHFEVVEHFDDQLKKLVPLK